MGETKPESDAQVIDLKETARILRVSYPTAHRLAQSGELKAFRVRNAWRTSTDACDEFIRRKFAEQALICQSVEMK